MKALLILAMILLANPKQETLPGLCKIKSYTETTLTFEPNGNDCYLWFPFKDNQEFPIFNNYPRLNFDVQYEGNFELELMPAFGEKNGAVMTKDYANIQPNYKIPGAVVKVNKSSNITLNVRDIYAGKRETLFGIVVKILTKSESRESIKLSLANVNIISGNKYSLEDVNKEKSKLQIEREKVTNWAKTVLNNAKDPEASKLIYAPKPGNYGTLNALDTFITKVRLLEYKVLNLNKKGSIYFLENPVIDTKDMTIIPGVISTKGAITVYKNELKAVGFNVINATKMPDGIYAIKSHLQGGCDNLYAENLHWTKFFNYLKGNKTCLIPELLVKEKQDGRIQQFIDLIQYNRSGNFTKVYDFGVGKFTLWIKVIDSFLPEPKVIYGIYNSYTITEKAQWYQGTRKTREQFLKELEFMRKFGITAPLMNVRDFSLNPSSFIVSSDFGRVCYLLSSRQLTDEQAYNQAKLVGLLYPSLYHLTFDEPTEEVIERILPAMQGLKDGGAYVAGAITLPLAVKYRDYYDAAIINPIESEAIIKEFMPLAMQEFRKGDSTKKICRYNGPQAHTERAELQRNTFGVRLLEQGYDCYFNFAWQHIHGDPYNDMDDDITKITEVINIEGNKITVKNTEFGRFDYLRVSDENIFKNREVVLDKIEGNTIYVKNLVLGKYIIAFNKTEERDHILAYPTESGELIPTLQLIGLMEGINDVRKYGMSK